MSPRIDHSVMAVRLLKHDIADLTQAAWLILTDELGAPRRDIAPEEIGKLARIVRRIGILVDAPPKAGIDTIPPP